MLIPSASASARKAAICHNLMPEDDLKSLLGDKKGTYILLLEADQNFRCRVGKLGIFSLPAGYYLYVGSALGPGGLSARLKHHTSPVKRPHWHLDYLRRGAQPIEVCLSTDGQRHECQWALSLFEDENLSTALPGFGSSDCQCDSHLYYARSLAQSEDAIRRISTYGSTPDSLLRLILI